MKTYLIADTHFNHGNIETYCQRPDNFTDLIRKNWAQIVKPEDTLIHLGDVGIGDWRTFDVESLPGRKILIRGNHDRQHSSSWWMNHGFDFACDALVYRHAWLTHEPQPKKLPYGCDINIHGHLHNIWHGFRYEPDKPVTFFRNDIQRLFAVEYTNYRPIEFDKFVNHPDKYLARGPGAPDVGYL